MAKQTTRQVSIFINGKEVENSIKGIAAEQSRLNNKIKDAIIGTEEYESAVKGLTQTNTLLREHRQAVSGIEKGWSLTKLGVDQFVGIAAGAFTVDAIIGYGKELFNTAIKMEGLEKKARVVFAETLPAVTEEAKKNATQMGLTTAEYVAHAAAIQDILVPMGFQRKQAAEISTQLVNLSGALSEWTGGQVSAAEVSDILSSALTGERERLKQLGIVLQQSDINARLAEKGQAKLEGTLRQQAEAAATLELVLEKSQDAQTAYAENADSMTRRTAELSAKFEEIKERLANALIPVFETLVSVIGTTEEGVTKLFTAISNTTVGDRLKEILGPFLGLGGAALGGTNLFRRVFGTKEEMDTVAEDVRKLKEETDALLVKYGVGSQPQDIDPNADKLSEEEKKKAAAAAKKRKEEAERLEKEAFDLVQRVANMRRDFIAKSQEDELAITINGIEDRYNKEIAKALELEKKGVVEATAQRIALEELKQQEIGNAVATFTEKSVEEAQKQAYENQKKIGEEELRAIEETEAFKREREEGRKAAEAEIKEFQQEALLSEQQIELEELEAQYLKLLELADDYLNSDLNLREAYEQKKKSIIAKNTQDRVDMEKEAARLLADAEYDLQIAKLEAMQQGAALLAGFFDQNSVIASALFAFEKALAIQQVIISGAAERAQILLNAERAATPLAPFLGPGLAAYVAALAAPRIVASKIRTGINIASIAATVLQKVVMPKTKQKATGRYLTVTGEDDGRRYNASVIPPPYTGLLPDHPVLFQSQATGAPVLASERGAEYFVSAEALRNPYVANLTRMIDNITVTGGRGVRQFAEGGENAGGGLAALPAPPAGIDPAILERNTAVMQALLNALQKGIVAVIPDQTITGIPQRLGKINDASGGYFG